MMPMDMAAFLDSTIGWLIRPSTALGIEVANLFISDMPDLPDACVACYQYGGEGPVQTFGNSSLIQKPRLQVTVRDVRSQIAMERSEEIYNILKEIKEQNVNGVFYHRVIPVSEPSEIGPDSGGRERVVCNYSVWKRG